MASTLFAALSCGALGGILGLLSSLVGINPAWGCFIGFSLGFFGFLTAGSVNVWMTDMAKIVEERSYLKAKTEENRQRERVAKSSKVGNQSVLPVSQPADGMTVFADQPDVSTTTRPVQVNSAKGASTFSLPDNKSGREMRWREAMRQTLLWAQAVEEPERDKSGLLSICLVGPNKAMKTPEDWVVLTDCLSDNGLAKKVNGRPTRLNGISYKQAIEWLDCTEQIRYPVAKEPPEVALCPIELMHKSKEN